MPVSGDQHRSAAVHTERSGHGLGRLLPCVQVVLETRGPRALPPWGRPRRRLEGPGHSRGEQGLPGVMLAHLCIPGHLPLDRDSRLAQENGPTGEPPWYEEGPGRSHCQCCARGGVSLCEGKRGAGQRAHPLEQAEGRGHGATGVCEGGCRGSMSQRGSEMGAWACLGLPRPEAWAAGGHWCGFS